MLDKELLLQEKLHFWQKGYAVVRNMFTPQEMAIVKQKKIEINEMNAVVDKARALQDYWTHQKRVHDPIVEADLNLPLPDFYKKFTGFSGEKITENAYDY